MRFLGIDFGEKRMGLAIANGFVALPFQVIKGNQLFLLKEVVNICRKEEIGRVVLGLPITREGAKNPMAAKVRKFRQRLIKRLNVEVKLWDERLTSQEAREQLVKAGFWGKKGRAKEDAVAAAIILQSYLDHQKQERRGNV